MTESTSEESLRLTSLDQIQTAWKAVSVSGIGEKARDFLDKFLDVCALMPEKESPSASTFMRGGDTAVIKEEIIDSLEFVSEVLPAEDELTIAATGLLKALRGEAEEQQ